MASDIKSQSSNSKKPPISSRSRASQPLRNIVDNTQRFARINSLQGKATPAQPSQPVNRQIPIERPITPLRPQQGVFTPQSPQQIAVKVPSREPIPTPPVAQNTPFSRPPIQITLPPRRTIRRAPPVTLPTETPPHLPEEIRPSLPPNPQIINKVDRFASIDKNLLKLNEDQFDVWQQQRPESRGNISYQDVQTYKRHVSPPPLQTVFSSPQQKVEIPPLNKIRTPQEFSLWLNNYRQNLPEEFRKRMYVSSSEFMQKNVFYPKFWGLIASALPPDEIEKLDTYTQSVRQSEIYPRFVYWRNHLPPQFRNLIPDELYEVYSYAKRYQKHTSIPHEEEIFEAHKSITPITDAHANTSPSKESTTENHSSHTSSQKPEIPKVPLRREERELDKPILTASTLPSDIPPSIPIGEIQDRSLNISSAESGYVPSYQPSDEKEQEEHRQQAPQAQRYQQRPAQQRNIQQTAHNVRERWRDIQNPQRVVDRAKQRLQTLKNPKQAFNNKVNTYKKRIDQGRKLIRGARNLIKNGGRLARTGATAGEVGAGAAGAGGFTVAGAGALTIGGMTLGTIFLIIFCVLMIIFVFILFFILFFAIFFGPQERLKRIILQKTVDKVSIPNPAEAQNPDDTTMTFTISASYDKLAQGVEITDEIPDNAVFYSATGEFIAYDKDGNAIHNPQALADQVKRIVWTIGTSPVASSSKEPAGWPTDGQVTQGPQGGTDHGDLYNRTKAESIDVANLSTTPLYATFDGIVETADFSCGNCNGKGLSPGNYGNQIILTNNEKSFQVLYGHLLPEPVVSAGQQVKRGDVIGYMGNTGYSLGSHLHFEFRNISLAPPNIPLPISPSNCDPDFGIPCSPNSITYTPILSTNSSEGYWFVLHRSRVGKQPTEELYQGVYGDKTKSKLITTHIVNPGVTGKSPTPRADLLKKSYWVVTKKVQNQGEAISKLGPDFLVLDIPYDNEFNGPLGYNECGPNGNQQCFWPEPGEFGLHGVGDTPSRLTDSGSSGCIRHSNDAITELYTLLKDVDGEIRYYVSED